MYWIKPTPKDYQDYLKYKGDNPITFYQWWSNVSFDIATTD